MTELPTNKILFGACEEVLRTLPDACVDSVITDPPYGLGTKEPTARDIELYLQGKSLDTGGDFMGKPWEIPTVPTWKECFRVLKPGGYVLSFAGTRTWDIMSIGLRAAGFDNRDTISSLFGSPCLQWLHGQGFPKSTNISKKLREKAKKAKKEEAERLNKLADLFEGYGTALKPAWEPILCFRKPLEHESLADQVEATGTGGLNINASRIKHANAEDFEKHKEQVERIRSEGGSWEGSWKNSSDLSGASEVTIAGRWPPNVVMSHSPECVQVGTGDPPVSACVDGCPVKMMDVQSGTLTSGMMHADQQRQRSDGLGGYHDGFGPRATIGGTFGDTGGASRFFPQFVPDAPFFYTGKASKAEKNDGLLQGKASTKKGERRLKLKDEKLTEEDLERLTDHWPMSGWDPKQPQAEYNIPAEIRDLFVMAKAEDNDHPTVKPVSLMAWLVALVTPVGGLVLDPYCGSGTTCVGALEKGCNYLAIERDRMYLKIAERRLIFLTEQTISKRNTKSMVDDMLANIDGSGEDD
jgi:site-specific DNA-methyltransferase (adenine-specific)